MRFLEERKQGEGFISSGKMSELGEDTLDLCGILNKDTFFKNKKQK
jgi:hypothetical protein